MSALASVTSLSSPSPCSGYGKLVIQLAAALRPVPCLGLVESTDRERARKYHEMAVGFLEQAKDLCEQKFRGAASLLQAISDALNLLGTGIYEDITANKLNMIKTAMVSGSGGITTHSGHWHNCVNGHPVCLV